MAFMKSSRHHILRNMINKSRDIKNLWHNNTKLFRSDNHIDAVEIVTSSGSGRRSHTLKGYVPVMVGNEVGVKEKFMVKTRHMAQPSIVALLELSADEFGYWPQHGVLRILCDPDFFREIISNLSNKNR